MRKMDFSPAKWIWINSKRTLPNTFALFRKTFHIYKKIQKARCCITADSRYLLTINGKRISYGPVPCDPRTLEVDCIDVTDTIVYGENVIGVQVLFIGEGGGLYIPGKPGLIVRLEMDFADGSSTMVYSENSWDAYIDRAHRPGQYRRWFLHAMQEEFDARLHPYGWDTGDFQIDNRWMKAYELPDCPPDKPPVCGTYNDYIHDINVSRKDDFWLMERDTKLMKEEVKASFRMAKSGYVKWHRAPEDWFDFRIENAYQLIEKESFEKSGSEYVEIDMPCPGYGKYAIFEMKDEISGFPFFEVEAAEGTIIELIWQEAHDSSNPPWLDTGYYNWARLHCRQGYNRFELFDWEAARWLQLHIRNNTGKITIKSVGIRRRYYAWDNQFRAQCQDKSLERLFTACENTINNTVHGILQADAARERQQYGQDGSRPLMAIRYGFGDTQISERFFRTFTQGQLKEGFLSDAWPSWDRLERMWEKVFGLSQWSLVLDASILFMQDVWNFYLYSGNKAFLSDYYPVLQKIVGYLETILDAEGLMKVDDIGLPNVWLDHFAFQEQRHKICALNLLVSGCLKEYFHKIANVLDKSEDAAKALNLANSLLNAVQQKFWDDDAAIYVCNLPWVKDRSEYLYDEMSLSFALIFNLCPGNRVDQCLEILTARPGNLGRVFASNCNWVYTALAKFGQMQFVLNDLRDIWAVLPPVLLNDTLPECLDVQPDTVNEWSHSAVVPLFSLYEDILGIQALQPGFERIGICPQLCDIGSISVDCYIPQGKIIFDAADTGEDYKITITIPKGCSGEFCISWDDVVIFNKYEDSSSFYTQVLTEGENKFVIKK